MHAVLKATAWQDMGFFEAENGDVWRVWFGGEPYPFIERLVPDMPEYREAIKQMRAVGQEVIRKPPTADNC